MMHDSEYKKRWDEKYKWYLDNDITAFENRGGKKGTLIVSEDKPNVIEDGTIRGVLSIKEMDQLKKNVFDS